MLYKIRFASRAKRELAKAPTGIKERISKRIDGLAEEPRPSDVKALKGKSRGQMRIRVGNYRIIYKIDEAIITVMVIRIAHRHEIYRSP